MYDIDLTVVNDRVDPQFGFMPLVSDLKIRMDCSSPYAMANLVKLKDDYSVAFGNDPDADRHGIVTPSMGIINPNHYLVVALRYLFAFRSEWKSDLAIGKTAVSSGIIDRVAKSLERKVFEVPVRDSNGSSMVCTLVGMPSLARRARGPVSCRRMARFGRPTKTESFSGCWRRNHGTDWSRSRGTLCRDHSTIWSALLSEDRSTCDSRGERRAEAIVPRVGAQHRRSGRQKEIVRRN